MGRGGIELCPRCGMPIDTIEERRTRSNTYYYAVHYYKDKSGKWRTRKCYLGPSEYYYVTLMHGREGLLLKGAIDSDRMVSYLMQLLDYVETHASTVKDKKRLLEKLRSTLKTLEEAVNNEQPGGEQGLTLQGQDVET